ncbi:ropporin-1-like protein [Leptonychotes weddellii]|uniref:Ropporin-1-like protein n=1 Tax=Leptonychotes weddellii TaxID=9713 RepID=A0A2U3YB82_LEPWE|nr:ropporin-1-like protein [Leptonychotes weddellii]
MPLPDTMFCAQQIRIPPELPDILKQFTKAAIRTQPADVLQWSAGYFSALSRGDPLPVKDRIEMPVATQKTDTGLTQGLLKVLHKQSLNSSMKHLCEILTVDPEGGPARIPFETFSYVYRYLSKMDSDIPEVDTESYLATLKDTVAWCWPRKTRNQTKGSLMTQRSDAPGWSEEAMLRTKRGKLALSHLHEKWVKGLPSQTSAYSYEC